MSLSQLLVSELCNLCEQVRSHCVMLCCSTSHTAPTISGFQWENAFWFSLWCLPAALPQLSVIYSASWKQPFTALWCSGKLAVMVFALSSQQLWTTGRRKYSGPGPKREAELERYKWVMEPGSAVSIDIIKGLKRTVPKEAKERINRQWPS